MNTEELVTLTCGKTLMTKGFDRPCKYMYARIYRVRDEILSSHPGLTQEQYLKMVDDGRYTLSQVYGNYIELREAYCSNTLSFIAATPNMVCARPSRQHVIDWLSEHHGITVDIQGNADAISVTLTMDGVKTVVAENMDDRSLAEQMSIDHALRYVPDVPLQ